MPADNISQGVFPHSQFIVGGHNPIKPTYLISANIIKKNIIVQEMNIIFLTHNKLCGIIYSIYHCLYALYTVQINSKIRQSGLYIYFTIFYITPYL